MSLELDITNALGRGRPSKPLAVEEVRELVPADLAMFEATQGTTPDPIKRISERHHMVARLLAAGTKPGEVSIITGLSLSRISILQNSPAMKDLIAIYRNEVEAEFAPVFENLAGMSQDAIGLIREKIEDEPESFSVKQLIDVAEMALDRTGHPRVKDVNQTVNIDLSTRLESARKRARLAASGDIVDAEVITDAGNDS